MRLGSGWNRRSFLGSLGVLAGSVMTPRKLFAWKGANKVTGFGQTGNPYEELGVKTVINCEGTMTVLGGSILRPELEVVMAKRAATLCALPILRSLPEIESRRC